mmetsp:Transcript_11991/g.32277  ORF Transcript_11991/g.32277 Transcript_11991/m.32277 type:complete len:217 (+) Transcript_11991:474-1124(+)
MSWNANIPYCRICLRRYFWYLERISSTNCLNWTALTRVTSVRSGSQWRNTSTHCSSKSRQRKLSASANQYNLGRKFFQCPIRKCLSRVTIHLQSSSVALAKRRRRRCAIICLRTLPGFFAPKRVIKRRKLNPHAWTRQLRRLSTSGISKYAVRASSLNAGRRSLLYSTRMHAKNYDPMRMPINASRSKLHGSQNQVVSGTRMKPSSLVSARSLRVR